MKFNKTLLTGFVILLSIPLLYIFPTLTYANIIDEILTGAKKLVSQEEKNIILTSEIFLVPDGDVDKNGEIDAGDIISFKYTIKNQTDKEHSFATLKTGIKRNQIHFIHNITGSPSLDDDGKTIKIPNYRIRPNQETTVTFDARINYSETDDQKIETTAELLGSANELITDSPKKEVSARKNIKEKIPSFMKHENVQP